MHLFLDLQFDIFASKTINIVIELKITKIFRLNFFWLAKSVANTLKTSLGPKGRVFVLLELYFH